MPSFRMVRACVLLAVFLLYLCPLVTARDDFAFAPISPAELAMKDSPGDPGAAAVILERQEVLDGGTNTETVYRRIKVLTDEGKKYADVEVPYVKDFQHVEDIRARVVQPDGSIVEFDGKTFDKVLARHKDYQRLAKTFTLPGVRAGSILEYRLKRRYNLDLKNLRYYIGNVPLRIFDWWVQDELFTRHAHFSLHIPGVNLSWTWFGLPGAAAPQRANGGAELDLTDIPAFKTESFMQPEDSLKARVAFFLAQGTTVQQFWKDSAKDWTQYSETFLDKHKAAAEEAARLVQASDSPEQELRKFYARAQQVRSLTYEREKTEKEIEREKLKDTNNVDEVLKHGYGSRNGVNRLFAAMARSQGFAATMVRVSDRDSVVFAPNLLDREQMPWEVVRIPLNGKDMYFDPGTPGCPFGLLPWEDTGTQAMVLSKDNSDFMLTPPPSSDTALLERKGDFKLAPDGKLTGKVEITYSGQDALHQRLVTRYDDEAGRRKHIEDRLKEWLPGSPEIKIESMSGWADAEQPIKIVASVTTSSNGSNAGKRVLLPLSVFESNSRNPFEHESRKYPIYFDYPFQVVDDVTVELPPGLEVENLPAAVDVNAGAARYQVTRDSSGSRIHQHRSLVMKGFYFETKYYPALRGFYSKIGEGDEEQIVLRSSQVASSGK